MWFNGALMLATHLLGRICELDHEFILLGSKSRALYYITGVKRHHFIITLCCHLVLYQLAC